MHTNVNVVSVIFSFKLPNIIQKHAILVKYSHNVLWVVLREKTQPLCWLTCSATSDHTHTHAHMHTHTHTHTHMHTCPHARTHTHTHTHAHTHTHTRTHTHTHTHAHPHAHTRTHTRIHTHTQRERLVMCVRPCVGEKEELALAVLPFLTWSYLCACFNHVRVGVLYDILDGWIDRKRKKERRKEGRKDV